MKSNQDEHSTTDSQVDELAARVELCERRRRDLQRLSGVGFWELNHVTGELYWSEEVFAIYELDHTSVTPDYALFESLIYDAERELVSNAYKQSVLTGELYDIRFRIKAGSVVKWVEARGVTYYLDNGEPERSTGSVLDITEVITAQKQIERMAFHDELTGLPNRKLFTDKLHDAIDRVGNVGGSIVVLFIDLDDFKTVNDNHGHDAGDQLLVSVANKLMPFIDESCVFARLGGDEFAGFIVYTDDLDVDSEVKRVKQAIDGIHQTPLQNFAITTSIGVAIFSQDDNDPDSLLRHADHAMYDAKQHGKSGIRYFDIERFQANWSRRHRLTEIEQALKYQEFELYFQPKVHLCNGEVAGAEALLRWFRQSDTVPPSDIVQAIRNTELEWQLDQWVLREVLSKVSAFKEAGLALPISLNMNPNSLQNRELPSFIAQVLAETNTVGTDIEIEILEVESIRDFDAARAVINACKELGVRFSIDDFGTGYSSLTYFHALSVAKVKIDQTFIRTINTDPESLLLVQSILAIAKEHHKPVVAEGIETLEIAQTLADLECEYGQGYGIAMPMSFNDYVTWSQNRQPWPIKCAEVNERA